LQYINSNVPKGLRRGFADVNSSSSSAMKEKAHEEQKLSEQVRKNMKNVP
jgi:hypothetical protein